MKYFAHMKRLLLLITSVLLIIGLVSAVSYMNQQKEVPEKHLEIVLRDIGHQLLLLGGDSSSRVLPVQQLKDNTYQLSFQNNFVFVPDSLINLVHRQLKKYHLPEEYTVSVKDCGKQETIFAYEISAATGNLVPCTGRKQEAGCYLIQIAFIKPHHFNRSWLLLLLLPLCAAGYYVSTKLGKKKADDPAVDNPDYLPLGKFRYYAAKNLLTYENKNIVLSEKESKALQIFSAHPDEVIEREQLMKAIWEDEGVIVISRNVDVLVSKLRRKLTEDHSIKIINVHGRGYRFIIDDSFSDDR